MKQVSSVLYLGLRRKYASASEMTELEKETSEKFILF